MSRRLAAVVVACAFVVMPAQQSAACTCAEQTAAEAFKSAEWVFAGIVDVVDVSPVGLPRAVIDVERVYKGEVPRDAHVDVGGRNEAECGVTFEPGRRYIVFASGLPMRTNLCAGTTDDAAALEQAHIKAVKTYPSSGSIARLPPRPAPADQARTVPLAAAWAAAAFSAAAWLVLRPA